MLFRLHLFSGKSKHSITKSRFFPNAHIIGKNVMRYADRLLKVLKTIYWVACYIFNYMLRCLDFKHIFIWPGFSHFFCFLSFLGIFFGNDTCAFWKCMCAPRGMESSLCTCSLKFPEFWKVQVHATWHVHWSLVPLLGTFRLKRKKQPKKISNGKYRHWLWGKNSKRHNFTNTEWNYALLGGICLLEYK